MYSIETFTKLIEVFPESININRKVTRTITKANENGTYEEQGETVTENLGECILNTAHAFEIKYGLNRALKYIEEFIPEKVKRQEIANFGNIN